MEPDCWCRLRLLSTRPVRTCPTAADDPADCGKLLCRSPASGRNICHGIQLAVVIAHNGETDP